MVRESWQRFEPRFRESGLLFYDQLFELDPTVAHLFRGPTWCSSKESCSRCSRRSWGHSDRPVELVGELSALGARHLGYGVQDENYPSVGSALLWLLAQVLGDEFTPELREAWNEAYLLASAIMRRGAARVGTSG